MLIHGNVSSSLFWQEIMQDLPQRPAGHRDRPARFRRHRERPGRRHARPAGLQRRRVRDARALGIPTAHLVGWSMGGGVVMQYALDHPTLQPHAAVARLAVRIRRHAPRRLTAHRRRRGHGRRRSEPRLRRAPHRGRHERRGGDLAAQRLPLRVRRRGLPERPRGRLGRLDAHDLDRGGQLPRRLRRERELARVRGRHASACSTRCRRSTSTRPASSTLDAEAADPVDPRHGRRDRVGCLVLRPQPPRRRSASSPAGRAPTSRRHSRWCRRPATCSTRTRRPAAR